MRAFEAAASITRHIGETQEVNSAELILKYCILTILTCKVSSKKILRFRSKVKKNIHVLYLHEKQM